MSRMNKQQKFAGVQNSPLKLSCKVTFITDCFILRSSALLLEKEVYTELLHAKNTHGLQNPIESGTAFGHSLSKQLLCSALLCAASLQLVLHWRTLGWHRRGVIWALHPLPHKQFSRCFIRANRSSCLQLGGVCSFLPPQSKHCTQLCLYGSSHCGVWSWPMPLITNTKLLLFNLRRPQDAFRVAYF